MAEKSLIIKGDRHEAEEAAAERGIPLVFVSECRSKCRYSEGSVVDIRFDFCTIGRTTADIEMLNKWFIETIEPPYPVGTLLHWA